MLEDIKTLVPEINENDSKQIFNNLIEKNKQRNEKPSLNKYFSLIVSFVITIAICIPLSVSIYKTFGNNSSSANKNPEEIYIPSYLLEDGTILGMAAHKGFDDKEKSNIHRKDSNYNSLETNDSILLNETLSEKEYSKYSYPFDCIKILDAYKFSVEVLDIPDQDTRKIIENSCGLGMLEVVVASFGIYEKRDRDRLYCVMEDRLIALRGHNGYYTILSNSGGPEKIEVFSSHKKIIDSSINKDFTPPFLTIFVENNNEKRNISFILDENKLAIENYNKDLSYESEDKIEYVSGDSVYSLFDIANVPTATVETKVISIDFEASEYGGIYVESDPQINLEVIYYNKYTQGVKLDSINIYDIIIVEYDMLYYGYNPGSIYANKVEVINVV